MANIIISFWTENGRVMYDAISRSLCEQGNDVMLLDMRGYIKFSAWGTTYTIGKSHEEYLWHKIKSFNPNLILSFNNIFPNEFVEKLDCPVCVLDADTPEMGFWNKDILKKNRDRYVFLGLQNVSKELYQKTFGTIKKFLYFPPCTAMINTHDETKTNISFIGSNFLYLRHFVYNYPFVEDKQLFKDVLKAYDTLNGAFCNSFDIFSQKFFSNSDPAYTRKIFEWFFYHNLSGMERISYLDAVSDLGLKIYGLDTWRELLYYNINLAKCFDDTNIETFEDNKKVYNESKIAINISHKQAVSSFSWRVMDIMASNSCLLMEDKPDWRELFEKYLSKDVLDTVIYKDRFDMREKAKKLLADEVLRQKCVKELNNAIEQNGRWKIRFKSLEQFLNITLLNLGEKGKLIRIERKEQQHDIKQETAITSFKKKKGLNLKKRVKLFAYLLLLAIWQIPILDLGVRRHKREKILHKVHKYWR